MRTLNIALWTVPYLLSCRCGEGSTDAIEEAARAAEMRPGPAHASDATQPSEPAIRVPDVTLRQPAAEATARAITLNLEGMEAYNVRDYPAAITSFVNALEADPSNHQARYNLACALAHNGQARQALDLLQQLKVANCTACRDKLDRARMDKDLSILRGHPRFEAIVAD